MREQRTAEESAVAQLGTQSVAGSSDGVAPGRRTSSRWASLIARIPARAPPQGLFDFDQTGGFDPADPEPVPELDFDQSLPD